MRSFKTLSFYIFDGLVIGVLTGFACSAFLITLSYAGVLFAKSPNLIYLLPLCGILTVWLYQKFGKESLLGNHLIIDEIHETKRDIPVIMAPLIFVTTIMSHLFGASVGREGTAVQMGASLSSLVSKKLNIDPSRRKFYLIAGMGAGFAAALGTPIAGVIFGMEVLHLGRFKIQALVQSICACIVAYYMTILLHAPHSTYPSVNFNITWEIVSYLILAAILMGIFARAFVMCLHLVEKQTHKICPNPYLKILFLSLLILGMFLWEGSSNYNGLGISVIQESFLSNAHWSVPIKKMSFTVLSLGAGFKGGEFTPLAFMGATLGSSIAGYFSLSTSLFAACGFSAVFAAASKTPLACAIMAAELFGIGLLPYALMTCLIAYLVSGRIGIYRYQR